MMVDQMIFTLVAMTVKSESFASHVLISNHTMIVQTSGKDLIIQNPSVIIRSARGFHEKCFILIKNRFCDAHTHTHTHITALP